MQMQKNVCTRPRACQQNIFFKKRAAVNCPSPSSRMKEPRESRYEQMRTEGSSVLRYATRFRGVPKTRTAENTRTCTAKQILEVATKPKQGGRFVIDNAQLYTVRLCGRIVRIEQNEGETDFSLDDSTGMLEGRIWPQTNSGKTGLSGASLGAYYVIIANVVTFSTGVLLQTLHAENVTDHNHVTLHLISAIHEHCAASALTNEEVDRWDAAEHAAKEINTRNLGLELNKEAIVDFLAKDLIRTSEHGASSDCITKSLQMTSQEAWATLRAMLDEGSIYNTVDYQHFKLADEN